MSKTVVVYAHPCYDSFAASMRVAAVTGLTRANHDIIVLDLHRDGIDLEGPLPEAHLDALADAQVLVVVYPTWWGGQPAILTGWLGLVAGLPGRAAPHARQVIAVTSHGSSKLSNALGGRPGYHVLRQFAKVACARSADRSFLGFYSIDTASLSERTAFLDHVTGRLAAVR